MVHVNITLERLKLNENGGIVMVGDCQLCELRKNCNNLLSGIIPKSGIALSTLHGAAIQRKTPALDWGKCLSSGGLGDFYCWRFCQEVVYLVSNLRCKGSDYFNNNNNNKVNKVKTTVYLDFI